jgi:hypothetical protein
MVNDHIHQVIYGTFYEEFSICTLCGMFGSYVVHVHAMKACKGSRIMVPFPWMEVNGQLHSQAALPLRKVPLVPIEYEAGGILVPIWSFLSSSSLVLQLWVDLGLLNQMLPTTSKLGSCPPVSTTQFP